MNITRRNFMSSSSLAAGGLFCFNIEHFRKIFDKYDKETVLNQRLQQINNLPYKEAIVNACWKVYEDCKKGKISRWEAEYIVEHANARGSIGLGIVAAHMCYNIGSSRKWAEKVVEKKDDIQGAYQMVKFCGSDKGWGMSVVTCSICGTPAIVAYCMCSDCDVSRLWAEKIIETDNVGYPQNVVWAADKMHNECGSSKEWFEMVKRRILNKYKNITLYA